MAKIIKFPGAENPKVDDQQKILAQITSNEDDYIQYQVELPFVLEINDAAIFLGDVTEDGLIDILDVVTLVNIVLDSVVPTNYQTIASDINQDSVINIQDIILLINLIMS